MSDIVLSAGVRQNLLSLQTTAQLMATTQNRLATGKKVNSALDNPGNFFTSQSLNNRASDLNALLDSIGQAQQTLKAADTGLTSLTKLVESAKSIAKQAQQAPQPGSTSYNAIGVTGNPTDETLATHDGTALADGTAGGVAYSFDIAINGGGTRTVNYTSVALDGDAQVLAGLQADLTTELAAAGYTGRVTLTAGAGGNDLKLDAVDADIDFTISAASASTGLTNAAYNSASLLDSIGGAATLSVAVNGGANQIISFGTGAGEVSTLAELNAKIGTLSGVTGSASNSSFSLNVASTTGAQNSLASVGVERGPRDCAGHFPEQHDPGHRHRRRSELDPHQPARRTSTTCCRRSTPWRWMPPTTASTCSTATTSRSRSTRPARVRSPSRA